MASFVFIIRVPFETQDDDSSREKEKRSSGSLGEKGQKNGGEVCDDDEKDQQLQQDKPYCNKHDEPADLSEEDNMELTKPLGIVEVLQKVLKCLKVQGDLWQITKDKQFHQVMFLEDAGERVDKILKGLTDVGIGIRDKSSLSVIPTTVHIQFPRQDSLAGPSSKCKNDQSEEESQPLLLEKESAKNAFIKSIKSKLTVEQVVEGVKSKAQLTFDFVMFAILASLIAVVGLVEDSSVVLVASMLVSPLMGPILGGTFGTVIKNRDLRNIGLKTEISGLIISVLAGFLYGFICGPFNLDGISWGSTDSWPTKEMTSRGMLRGLWVGVLIALPSGAGVALSVLGGNTGSLVGVAISASLLPPAVNSGVLWAYSIICAIKHPTLLELPDINGSQVTTQTSECPALKDNNYKPMYNCDMAKEAAIMAIISFVLTIVNILCILITGTLVLKLKEVAPRASSSNALRTFWTKDVKVARKAYQTFKGGEATNLRNTFLKEWKKLNNPDQEVESPSQNNAELVGIIQEVEEDETFQITIGKAPNGRQYKHQCSRELKKELSVEEGEVELEEGMALFHQWTSHNQWSMHPKTGPHHRHASTLFHQTPKVEDKKGRKYFVTDIEKPHHTSVVRVRPPTETSEKYSVLTESGV